MRLTPLVLCLLLATPSAARAQKTLMVDMTRSGAAAPKDLVVSDRDRASLVIRKNPFHACAVTTKTEALAPPPSPIAQILGALGAVVAAAAPPGPPTRVDDPLASQVEALVRDVDRALAELAGQLEEVRLRAAGLTRAVACDTGLGALDPCANVAEAAERLRKLAREIEATPKAPVAATAMLASRAAELGKVALARSVKSEDAAETEAISALLERLRDVQARIDLANARRAAILAARDTLSAVRERVLAFTPSDTATFPLSPAANARTVATVTCANVATEQPAIYHVDRRAERPELAPLLEDPLAPVPATVTFRRVPWATVTAGLLASDVDRREIGVATVNTNPSAGAATVERRVAVVESGGSQLVPFTFFNLLVPRLSTHRMSAAATVGFGLNPHNGSKQLEYFIGGALGIGRYVAITAGRHIGSRMEPDGGFAVGDVVPASVTTVPTRRDREAGWAVGLSYGVPLPK